MDRAVRGGGRREGGGGLADPGQEVSAHLIASLTAGFRYCCQGKVQEQQTVSSTSPTLILSSLASLPTHLTAFVSHRFPHSWLQALLPRLSTRAISWLNHTPTYPIPFVHLTASVAACVKHRCRGKVQEHSASCVISHLSNPLCASDCSPLSSLSALLPWPISRATSVMQHIPT